MTIKYNQKISIIDAIKQHNKTLVELWNSYYINFISNEDIENINNTSQKILDVFEKNKKSKILIAGNIQSGKTSFFINLIANIFDKGLQIGYVAAGTTKILFNQNKDRIMKVFNKKVLIYDKYNIENNLNDNISDIISKIKNGNKVLFVGLKSKKHIDFFQNILQDIKEHTNINHSFFIDDEGDQASFDNVALSEVSPTHKSIEKLIINNNVFFISITATPFAHEFVKNSIIKPDKVFVLKKSLNYNDLSFFRINNLYKIISNDEKTLLLEKNIMTNSLKRMLLEYFINCSYFQLIKGEIYNTTAIVHTHTKNEKHNKILKFIDFELKKLKNNILLKEYDSIINELINEKNIIINSENDFQNFKKLILEHIKDTQVLELNQKKNNLDSISHNTIYIGSYLLGRGITFNNLLSVYYCNRKNQTISNADTILQRVRWLGYRNSYAGIISIYIDKTSYQDIINLEEGINKKYNKWMKEEDNNKNFKENNLIPELEVGDALLRATRQTVADNNKQIYNLTYQDRIISNDKYAELIHKKILKKHNLLNILNKNFKYTKIKNIEDNDILTEEIKNHISKLFDIPHFFKDIEKEFNSKLCIININENIRKRSILDGKINQLFEGRNNNYLGDTQFINGTFLKNNVIIQIHKIYIENIIVYKFALILPYKFSSNYVRAI